MKTKGEVSWFSVQLGELTTRWCPSFLANLVYPVRYIPIYNGEGKIIQDKHPTYEFICAQFAITKLANIIPLTFGFMVDILNQLLFLNQAITWGTPCVLKMKLHRKLWVFHDLPMKCVFFSCKFLTWKCSSSDLSGFITLFQPQLQAKLQGST